MVFKKVGMVTVGVTAGLLVAAPLASAGEAPDPGHHSSSASKTDDNCVSSSETTANGVVAVPVSALNGNVLSCNDVSILDGNAVSVLGPATANS